MKITAEIITRVEASIAHMSLSPFSWPDDGCFGEEWSYEFHREWIRAWDAENRTTPAIAFLRTWMEEQPHE